MTIATSDALMNGGEVDDFINAYKKWGRLFSNAGYGSRFKAWINSDVREPYNSRGNGSAMRVSPCAEYAFKSQCPGDRPENSIVHARQLAIIAFLESTDFEDAIRNAISLGGDSDTLAAITGSIAEAAYGVPDWIRDKALSYLDAPLRGV